MGLYDVPSWYQDAEDDERYNEYFYEKLDEGLHHDR